MSLLLNPPRWVRAFYRTLLGGCEPSIEPSWVGCEPSIEPSWEGCAQVLVCLSPRTSPCAHRLATYDCGQFCGMMVPLRVGVMMVPLRVDVMMVPLRVCGMMVPLHVGVMMVPLRVDVMMVPLRVCGMMVPLHVGVMMVPLRVGVMMVPLRVGVMMVPLRVGGMMVPLRVDVMMVPLRVGGMMVPLCVGVMMVLLRVGVMMVPLRVGVMMVPLRVGDMMVPLRVGGMMVPLRVGGMMVPLRVGCMMVPLRVDGRLRIMFSPKSFLRDNTTLVVLHSIRLKVDLLGCQMYCTQTIRVAGHRGSWFVNTHRPRITRIQRLTRHEQTVCLIIMTMRMLQFNVSMYHSQSVRVIITVRLYVSLSQPVRVNAVSSTDNVTKLGSISLLHQ